MTTVDRDGYVHDALLYGTQEELLSVAVPFLRGGLDADEFVIVHASPARRELLTAALGRDSGITFLGEAAEGHPARTLTHYVRLLDRAVAAGARAFRVVGAVDCDGDPGRCREWIRYEAAVNRVLAPYPIWGLCAYDTRTAPAQLVTSAELTHPTLVRAGARTPNPRYRDPADLLRGYPVPFGTGDDVPVLDVDDVTDLSGLRTDAYLAVLGTDLGADTVDDFVFALSEVATNALAHGRPSVRVRLWATPERLVATVSDRGPGIADPFAGYPPPRDRPGTGGVGLWAARQMCDELTFAHVPGEGFTVWLAMGT